MVEFVEKEKFVDEEFNLELENILKQF